MTMLQASAVGCIIGAIFNLAEYVQLKSDGYLLGSMIGAGFALLLLRIGRNRERNQG